MIEIRFHGRGGQGVVVAAKILADSILKDGKYCLAIPEFGVERRGAPVYAFARIDDKEIFLRSRIYEPDHVVVLDPVLVYSIDVTSGLKKNGTIVINSEKSPEEFSFSNDFRVYTIDATGIAVKWKLGTRASPIVNTAILGAVAKILGITKIESLIASIKESVPTKPEENAMAAKEAYEIAKG
ncbi:MAG: 2-oxoacid:acceptor oxidoreductase family protein [Acidobacteriota bacterium]